MLINVEIEQDKLRTQLSMKKVYKLWAQVANRVATVREKSLENEIFSRSGKSQGVSILVREI